MGIYSGTICYLIFSYLAIKKSLSTQLAYYNRSDHIIKRNLMLSLLIPSNYMGLDLISWTNAVNSILIRRTTIKRSLTVQTYRIREVNFPDQYLFNYN